MIFWVTAFLIAALTALSLLVALRRGGATQSAAASDLQVYRDQLKEVDRDLARGVLTEEEAETVRTEVSRRLLDADRRARQSEATSIGASLPVMAIVVATLIAGGALLYARIGAPGYRDLPMATRLAEISAAAANRIDQEEAEGLARANLPAAPPPDEAYLELMTQLRGVLSERPNDLRGLELLAQNEARLGNYTAARAAQGRILEIKGEDAAAADLIAMIDLMVYAAGGYVSPEAEELVRRLISLAPQDGAARYYAGLTMAQNGRPDQAFPIWRRLLEDSRPGAPWVPVIRAEIEGLAAAAGVNYQLPAPPRGPDADAMAAAQDMSEDDRQAMIEGMVEGLAERLATDGGTAEEWAQLITALGVLGQTDRASAIAEEARTVFASSTEALDLIERAAEQAGIAQ